MTINAAPLSSVRLQRVLKVLSDGKPHTTREILRKSGQCAINSIAAELRHHGAEIICARRKVGEQWRFFYTMTKGPTDA